MAALPPIKRITKEDLKDAPAWIDRLLYPLNLFLDTIYSGLNHGLTFSENIRSMFYSFSLTAGAAAANNTLKFTSTMVTAPKGLILLNVFVPDTNYAPIGSPVFIEWYFDGKYVNITSIAGLTNGKIYDFTILMI